MKKIAVIGAGNMGSSIAASLAGGENNVVCTAASAATRERIAREIPQASVAASNAEATEGADIVVLAVKPYIAPEVFPEIRSHIRPGATVISVIAGLTLADLKRELCADGHALSVFRVIPNTAIRYGKSVTFIAAPDDTPADRLAEVERIFNLSGRAFVIKEKDMAACTALASCGIAYFLRFIRACAEGGVEVGLKAGFATQIASLTAEGAAALLADGSHPEAEIDKVTTPGGITIRGLNALEANGFNHAVIEAIRASTVR